MKAATTAAKSPVFRCHYGGRQDGEIGTYEYNQSSSVFLPGTGNTFIVLLDFHHIHRPHFPVWILLCWNDINMAMQ
jgi:hypothetical protein